MSGPYPYLDDVLTERFRILIIGNANAGKTTILEKVCHARGHKPEIWDAEGNKIVSELNPSASRGEHEIETQIVYPTAHEFIFHDSRGFEAGASDELDKVRDFLTKRSKRKQLKDQLHAIWYCVPTSNDRPMSKQELAFFEIDTGNVPVVVIFTKMDALDNKASSELVGEGVPFKKAKEEVHSRAKTIFERDYERPFLYCSHQPRHIAQLRNMDNPDKHCDELVRDTARVLDGRTFVVLVGSK